MADAMFFILISSFSFITFLGIFLLSPWISNYIFSSYKHLPFKKQVNWNTRIGSNIHAVIATTVSVYTFIYDEGTFSDDPFCKDAFTIRCGISLTFGYILADLLVILWYYKYCGDIFTVVHHIMALWAYVYCVVFGHLLFYANVRQLAEVSTLFVNQRWFYDVIGYPRSSRYFIANGLMMTLTFFLGRIMFIPYFYYKSFSVWHYPKRRELGPFISLYWIMTSGTLDVINLYWFKKIVKGGAKLLMHRNEDKKVE